MEKLKHRLGIACLWLMDRMAGTYISLLLITGGSALAATTYTVYNVPDMFLYAGINTTITTNIRVTGPIKNRVVVSYPALTGGVLELREGSKVEHIYYSRATVDATTKVITLTGSIIRDLCWNTATTYVGCNAGQSFSRGARVRLVDDNRLFNLSPKLDTLSTTTGSGGYKCGSTSQPCLFTVGVTTAQRDAFTFGTASGLYPEIMNTTLGIRQYWNGSAWINYGSGATVNATEVIRGAVELANFTEVTNLTLTGSTNALVVLTPRHLTKNGTSTGANKIPLLNGNGLISLQMGGNGTGGVLGIATGSILVYQKMGTPRGLYPTATNQVIVSTDGRNWNPGAVPQDVNVLTGSIASTASIVNPQVAVYFTQTGSLTTQEINTVGKKIVVMASGIAGWGAGSFTVSLKIGSGTPINCSWTPTADDQHWISFWYITIQATGASGTARITSTCDSGSGNNRKGGTASIAQTFDTTTTQKVNIGASFGASNGANDATMFQFDIDAKTN